MISSVGVTRMIVQRMENKEMIENPSENEKRLRGGR